MGVTKGIDTHGAADGVAGLGFYPVMLIGVSMACLSLAATLMYVMHSRKYRLNWFERNRLDSITCEEATVVKLSTRQRYHSGSTCGGGSLTDLTAAIPTVPSRSSSVHRMDAQSLKSVASNASVVTTLQTPLDQAPLTAANSDSNMGDISPSSDVSSVIQKYVQPCGAQTPSSRPKVTTMYEKLDHTKFNADMYRVEGDSSSLGGDIDDQSRPKIHFSTSYTPHFSVLCVRVVQAQGISSAQEAVTNPYVRVKLIPETGLNTQPKIGQVHKNTLEPQFEEDFIFNGITITDLNARVLEIVVFNKSSDETDRSSMNQSATVDECLGGLHWSLDQMVDPLREQNIKPVTIWMNLISLDQIKQSIPENGELQLSMSYLQSAERLTVSVLKARGLNHVDADLKKGNTSPDSFVKVTLTSTSGKSGKTSKKKKKTNVQRNTACPIFNEAFTFNIGKEAMRTASLQLSVAHEIPSALQQKEVLIARLQLPAASLSDFVHSPSHGVQAKWFRLQPPQNSD